MPTRRTLRALINGTLRQTPERQQLPRAFDHHAPQLSLLPMKTLNDYDELFCYPPCFNTNDRDEELHVQLEFTYQHDSKILHEISAIIRAHAEERAACLDGVWWRDFMHRWTAYLELLRELARRLRDDGTAEALGWLMRACPNEFWDRLWWMLLCGGYKNPEFLDMLCAPSMLRRALEESQASRDACHAGFEHWYLTDESLGLESVQRVLESTGLMPVPLPEALGPDTRSAMPP